MLYRIFWVLSRNHQASVLGPPSDARDDGCFMHFGWCCGNVGSHSNFILSFFGCSLILNVGNATIVIIP